MNTNEKIYLLRTLMKDNGIDYYIIPTMDPHGSEYIDNHYKAREYFTSFTGSAGTLVVSMSEACLFVDGRYHIQAENEIKGSEIKLYKVGNSGVKNYIQYLNENVKNEEVVGFDGNCFTESCFCKIRENNRFVLSIENDLAELLWKERPERTSNTVYKLDEKYYEVTSCEKIKNVREKMKINNLDGLFISELADIMWLFNIRGSDIQYNPVAFSYCYLTNDTFILFLQSGSYDEKIENYIHSLNGYIACYEEINIEIAKIKGKRIGADKESVSCLKYKMLSCGNEIIPVKNYEYIKKYIKDKNEIINAKKVHEIDAVSMIRFIIWIKENVKTDRISEFEAADYLDNLRRKNKDFVDLSFDTISAYAENGAIVHYSPDKNKSRLLEPKGLLLVDSGAQYKGATTDITRTISLGNVSLEEKRDYTLALKGNLKLMDAVFLKGVRGENLDIIARESLWKYNLDYKHGTGHGIGSFLNVHEGPCSIRYKINEDCIQPEIEPGLIISDEPGLYIEGKYGIRHETQLLCVLKTENEYGTFFGFEPLSLVPFEKDMLILDLMTKEEINILNNYHSLCLNSLEKYLTEDELKWLKKQCSPIEIV